MQKYVMRSVQRETTYSAVKSGCESNYGIPNKSNFVKCCVGDKQQNKNKH
jgi:hypothetical protein